MKIGMDKEQQNRKETGKQVHVLHVPRYNLRKSALHQNPRRVFQKLSAARPPSERNITVLSRCYAPFVVTPAPPLFSAKLLLRSLFAPLYIRPPHLHTHTCVWLALTSMFTLVLRCYYVVIFAKCVRLFPCGRLRTCGTGL